MGRKMADDYWRRRAESSAVYFYVYFHVLTEVIQLKIK